MDCCISGLDKYKVVLVLARSLCVMILDIEMRDIEYELPQLEILVNLGY
jgi:hypothetical protein